MNSIGLATPQERGFIPGPTGTVAGPALQEAQEAQEPARPADGVVLTSVASTAQVEGPATTAPTAGPSLPSVASQASTIAGRCAAAAIGGPAGHVLGVTTTDLAEFQGSLEKGYHLPENFINGYFDRRIFPYQNRPTYHETDGSFYRGMYITVDDLANILENGFEVKRNTWSAVGGQGVYVTTSEREAEDYIFQAVDYGKKNAIGVVFKMERGDYATLVEDPDCNSTNTIYKAANDVPSDRITQIYLKGQYGLESLQSVIERAQKGEIEPNTSWVNQFDSYLSR